jgi:hypothetical protein
MTDSNEKSPFFDEVVKKHFVIFFLLGLATFIALARYHTYDEPLEHDITTAIVMANEMRLGRPYYSDLWENKPPAQYVAYIVAQTLFGYGRGSLYALNITLGIITLLGVYSAASSVGGGHVAGLWAAVFWTLISGDLDLGANQPNTEAFMNPPLIWALALLLRIEKSNTSSWLLRLLAIGSLLALASFYKPHSAFYGVFLGLAHVIFPPERTPAGRKRAITEVLLIGLVGAIAWGAFFAYFALTGRFQILYTTMFVYPSYYSGNLFKNLADSLANRLFPTAMHSASPLVFLSLIGGTIAWIRRSKRPLALLLAYAIATQFTIGIAGRSYNHYYQLWLPLLAVGAGWSVVLLANVLQQQFRKSVPHAFAAVAVLFILQAEIWAYRMDPQEWSKRSYGGVYAAAEILAGEIAKIVEPGETLYVLGDEPGFYFHTRTRPAVGTFFLADVAGGPLADELTGRALKALASKPPDLVIIMNSSLGDQTVGPLNAKLGPEHPLRSWVSQNYCPAIENATQFFTICARPGSSLERRDSYQSLRSQLLE